LLRLAQPGQRATDFGTWMQRAAAALIPAATSSGDAPSIITLLTPSHQLATRS
jgi:hypothetical protein